jgi:hypothetical protein
MGAEVAGVAAPPDFRTRSCKNAHSFSREGSKKGGFGCQVAASGACGVPVYANGSVGFALNRGLR